MKAKNNLVGQRFGRLVVLEETDERQSDCVVWLCQCDCGNLAKVCTRSLNSGNTQSCGCLHKEKVAKQFSKDITNQRFGRLVALSPTEKRKHGSVVWTCQCDCGNTTEVPTELLLSGNTQSCGCTRSRGNAKIKGILQQNNFVFTSEYPVTINNIVYHFDFAIFENDKLKCFIEYDGILHFKQDKYHGWNNDETWQKTQRNDAIKNEYCKQNNIPLLRIPYTDLDKIDFDYIKGGIDKICPTIVDMS